MEKELRKIYTVIYVARREVCFCAKPAVCYICARRGSAAAARVIKYWSGCGWCARASTCCPARVRRGRRFFRLDSHNSMKWQLFGWPTGCKRYIETDGTAGSFVYMGMLGRLCVCKYVSGLEVCEVGCLYTDSSKFQLCKVDGEHIYVQFSVHFRFYASNY